MKKTIASTAMVLAVCLSLSAGAAAVSAESYNSGTILPAAVRGISGVRTEKTSPLSIDMGCVMISEPGDYTLTGEMTGTVYVDPGSGDVNITFDGVRIDGGNSPAIVAVSGDNLHIELAEGSSNYMSAAPDKRFGAVFCSDIPVDIGGGGSLDIMCIGAEAFKVRNGKLNCSGCDIRIIKDEKEDAAADPDQENAAAGAADTISEASSDAVHGSSSDYSTVNPSYSRNTSAQSSYSYSYTDTDTDTADQSSYSADTDVQPSYSTDTDDQPAYGGSTREQPLYGGSESRGSSSSSGETESRSDESRTDSSSLSSTDEAGTIVSGITGNSAMSLTADTDNSVTYDVSETSSVTISESGTYVITGSASEGSITVKKGTTGVVLILEDLDLTSTSGAVLSINKEAEVQVIVSGNVTLTDNEDPADEYSDDEEVADAYDGAAIKIKAGAVTFIKGSGTLTINGNAKNGIKAGDDTSLIIGGDVTVNINAANDGINGNYDVTILSGNINISAGDDGIHADHILTVGSNGSGPALTVTNSNEGLEGTVVNIAGGTINVTASDDGINAANSDGTYEGELDYSINITGGSTNVNAGTDGLDSNGNINLIGGSLTVHSANVGGDAGLDYDGDLYIDEGFDLNNASGAAGPDEMPGGQGGEMPGGQGGEMPGGQGGSSH